MKKRKLLICMGLLWLCTVFGACTSGQSTVPPDTAPQETDPPPDSGTDEPALFPLARDAVSEFTVVHNLTGTDQLNMVRNFISDFSEVSGVRLSLKTQNQTETGYEILIGSVTTRTESRELLQTVPYSGAAVQIVGNKIVVAAYRTEELEKALNGLSSAMTQNSNGVCGIPQNYSYESDLLKLETKIPKLTFEKQNINQVYYCGNNQYEVSANQATLADMTSYRTLLEADGYQLHAENSIADNRFATYSKGDAMVHLSWYPAITTLKCVFGELGYLPETEPTTSYESVVAPSLTQLGRKGALNSAPGMSYVIQLADGSYIIIDGGPKNDEDSADLLNFLKTNNPNEGKPQITWMITHADPDHMNLANAFLSDYHSEVTVNMVCYNFPDFNTISISSKPESAPAALERVSTFESLIKRYYPNADIFVVHAGQKLYLPGCEIEFIYTHEDQYPNSTGYLNHTNTAWRMKIAGKTVMFLGDSEKTLCQQMATVYGAELKSDVLQVSHHGLNGACTEIYQAIDPDICLWPIDDARFASDPKCLGTQSNYEFNKWLRQDETRIHYSSSNTVTLVFPDLQVRE